jgi:hypothetical protein
MAWVELECVAPTCKLGPAEGRWRTPKMPSKDAVNMLGVHARVKHSVTNKWVGEQFNQGQNIVDRESSEASIINEKKWLLSYVFS